MFSLARALFSPGSAEDDSSLFVWFIDSMARSDSSRACTSAVWLWAFADRPPSLLGRGAPIVDFHLRPLFAETDGQAIVEKNIRRAGRQVGCNANSQLCCGRKCDCGLIVREIASLNE